MNKDKCKGCEWYGKPYWSIINPCEHCPREVIEGKIEVFTRYVDPSIEEMKQEIYNLEQGLNKKNKIIEEIKKIISEMVLIGYKDNNVQYWAIGEGSEFGCRAEVLLNKIEELEKSDNNE